jgi:DNA mismatch repair ATPase MutS
MNVFLLHPDQDYDPKQALPANEDSLVQDLELTTLLGAMAQGDPFLFDIARKNLLTGLQDPQEIRYRQDILKDCLKNAEVVRAIYEIPIESAQTQRKRWMGILSRSPGGVLSGAVQLLEMFVGLLKRLRRLADENLDAFESQGFRRFFLMLQQELDDDYFASVEEHLCELKFRDGVLLSAALGRGNEGADYLLCRRNTSQRTWVKRVFSKRAKVYSFTIHPRDDHGARAVGDLRERGINLVANAVGQSSDHINSFLNLLRSELAFYIGCLNLAEQLAGVDGPIAFPDPFPGGELQCSYRGLYDACLALTMKHKTVGNDGNADGKELAMITGANQGGKSTFLRSIGLAQLMMQAGMFVPAELFRANLVSGLFTHYRREEDSSMTSGKLDEELGRMSDIIGQVRPGSMVLLNEPFAATNEREGSEIARQIVSALLERHIKVFFVTHQFELANGFYLKNMPNVQFLRAERNADGSRSFKLVEAQPLQTSFGKDLYQQIFNG